VKPIWYGPLARFGDWYYGWRDGRAGVPDRARGHATTPYREFLIRRAQDAFEHERLRFEASRAQPERAMANANARYEMANAALELAQQRRAEVPSRLASGELNLRRAGETNTAPLVVRSRRTREHHRRVSMLDAAVRSAQREVDRITVELAELRELVVRQRVVARTRVRRIHEYIHRRLAVYRGALVRHHFDGAWANQMMDSLAPELPGWATVGLSTVDTEQPAERIPPPEAPEAAAATPSGPIRTGRTFTVGDQPVVFGSAKKADVRISGYRVAENHARVRRQGDRVLLEDSGQGETFQAGERVRWSVLADGDSFTIGDYQYVRHGDTLEELWVGRCDLIVAELSAVTRGRPRITLMSFAQPAKSMLAIVGPSGSGKSSLFSALTGELPAASGQVFFDKLKLLDRPAEIRAKLGFVPQDNPVHHRLTALQVLRFTDQLRAPKDVPAPKRARRINQVLDQLKIDQEQRNRPLSSLSGGQLKRVSMAMEILSGPQLLLLDEPTSGLDSGMDQEVMMILSDIAAHGCTVVVVTHSTEHLAQAERVLVVAPGGNPVYYGTPQGNLPKKLGEDSYANLMMTLANRDRPPTVLIKNYQASQVVTEAREWADQAAGQAQPARPRRVRGAGWLFLRQFPVLVRRQVALLWAQRARVLFTPVVLPALGAVLAGLVAGHHGLRDPGPSEPTAVASTLSFLITLCALVSQALTYSDLVNDYPVIRREHRTGVVTTAVVLAKWLVFAVLAVIQAVVITAVFRLWRGGPSYHTTLAPTLELFVDLALTGVCAMSLGLFISAVSRNLPQAVGLATGAAVAQVALNGVTVNLANPAWFLTGVLPARWGLAAAAVTVDLRRLNPRAPNDGLWQHSTGQWQWDLLMLLVLTGALTGLAVAGLRWQLNRTDNRPDPG